jgi:choline-sulfatase
MRRDPARRPNIVFILSDQHNADLMGCAGDPLVRTPAMDALAASGTRLTACYCASPLCVPSRSALLTGVLPDRTGVFTNHQALPSHWPTFLHSLVASGYHTALAGRMHFMGPDQRHGYLDRVGKDMCPTEIGAPFGDLGELQPAYGQSREAVLRSGPGTSTVQRYDLMVADHARDYLEGYSGAEPLFLTVGFYAPHNPYVCPLDLYEHYAGHIPAPTRLEEQRTVGRDRIHPAQLRWYENRGVAAPEGAAILRARAAYYGMVELLDRRVGEISDAAHRRFGDDVVIVYASDHGDMAGDLGMFWKSSMYDGSVKVPVIVSDPSGRVTAWRNRKTVDSPTSLLDLPPTILSIAGAEQLPVTDGVNLTAEHHLAAGSDRAVLSMLGDLKGDEPSAMIRLDRWKLLHHSGYDEVQLFDLHDDPDELCDLGVDPARADVRGTLLAMLMERWEPEIVQRTVATNAAHLELFRAFAARTRPEMPEYLEPSGPENRLERPAE